MSAPDRRRLLVQGTLIAAGAALTGSGVASGETTSTQVRQTTLRDALVGTWHLVSCVETDIETGTVFLPMGEHPRGLILYTPDGYMSAQLSAPDRTHFANDDMYRGTPREYVAAGKSYLAYSGPYYVDEVRRTVTHEMAVSLFPNWTGQRQVRIARLEGETLHLATAAPAIFDGTLKTALITWRRAADLRRN